MRNLHDLISNPMSACQVCKAARVFNPSFINSYLTPAMVDTMVETIKPIAQHIDASLLKQQLPALMAASQDVHISSDDVHSFSSAVLSFWRGTSHVSLSEWRKAARIVFCLSPNSASCERVFSLLEAMYGDGQARSLADHIQSSLMLRYNKRVV